ncbi:MAG: toll/interleukin-1 receptor domain-containing protein, partial [Anaerolineae bacterium]|nr:toll/interleukin-1 receptor domain-containing protein [Anaerolineae bacterium]
MQYFISYSRMELTFADSLAQELKARGIEAWLDTYQLVPGIDWQQQICDAIRAASTVLVIASQDSLASANCQVEIATAQALGKDIILLQLDDAIYSQPVPEDWAQMRHCLEGEKPVVDWQRLQACKRVHFGGSFDDALAALIDLMSGTSQLSPQRRARYPTGVERLLTLRRLWFWFGVFWLALLLFSLTVAESARALNPDAWLGEKYLAYRLFKLDVTQTWLASLIVAGLVIVMLVWTVRVTRKIRIRAHRFWPTLFNTILAPLVFCLAGALTLTNIQFGATTMLRYSEAIRRADEASFQMPGYLQPLNEQIALPLFLVSAVLAMIIVHTMLRLLGGRDMYRWAGTYGVLLSEFHGWEHFGPSASRLILPGLILVPLCGMLGVGGSFVGVVLILLSVATLAGVTWALLIPAVRTAGRSAADYRRHWADDSAGGRVRVALDSAPQDGAMRSRFEKAIGKFHDITSLEHADIVVTLLSTHKRSTVARTSQTVIPVLLDGPFPEPEEDDRLSKLQTIDWRRSVTTQTLNSFAQLLNRPAQLAAALGNFPRKLSTTEQRPQAVNTMILIVRGLQIVVVVLTVYLAFSVVFAQPLPEPVAQELAEIRANDLQYVDEDDSYYPVVITHFGEILPDYWHVVMVHADDYNLRQFGALEAIIDENGMYEVDL